MFSGTLRTEARRERRGDSSDARGRAAGRASAVCRFADLRPTDHVLDVGCGEGVVTLEVARHVEHVHGFDVSSARVQRARRSAAERGIQNATFEVMSIQDFPFEPLSWDVALFMRVWGKSAGTKKSVGAEELARILSATRRQLIMLAGAHYEQGLAEMLDVCNQHEFDALCFSSRPNLLLANRREAGTRVGELPALAIVPTAWLSDHPMVLSSTRARASGRAAWLRHRGRR